METPINSGVPINVGVFAKLSINVPPIKNGVDAAANAKREQGVLGDNFGVQNTVDVYVILNGVQVVKK